MKNFLGAGLSILLFLAGIPVAAQAGSNVAPARPLRLGRADTNTFVGILTDSHCRAKHDTHSDKSSAGCTRSCVRHGAKYVIVAGSKVYVLDEDGHDLSLLAGQKVKITGALTGSVIKVSSVDGAQ